MKERPYLLIAAAIVLSLAAFFTLQTIRRGPVTITTKLSAQTVRLGDPVTYYIFVQYPKGSVIDRPAVEDDLKDFDILDKTKISKLSGGNAVDEYRYVFIPFKTGDMVIPPVKISLAAEGNSPSVIMGKELRLTVKSALKEPVVYNKTIKVSGSQAGSSGQDAGSVRSIDTPIMFKIKDGQGLRGVITHQEKIRAAWAAISVMAVGLAAWIVMRISRSRRPHPLDRYELAQKRLDEIKVKLREEGCMVHALCFDLSAVLKDLLKATAFRALRELTDTEFIKAISNAPALTSGEKVYLNDFFERYDFIKFSGHCPQKEALSDDIARVSAFVSDIKVRGL